MITKQVPENFISKDVFDLLATYILPKRELENLRQVITINSLGIKIVGYPVKYEMTQLRNDDANETFALYFRILNPRYPRNALYFNLCFVCDHFSRSV